MAKNFWRGSLFAIAFTGMLAGQALADGGVTSAKNDTGEQIARMEKLLQTQQLEIESLEQRLVSAGAQDQDAARVEAMKQQIREVLSEQEFRESLMPSMLQAGYDKGFFIKSSDEKFLLKMTGRMQFRWTHYNTSDNNRYLTPRLKRNDRTGFDIQRMFLNFTGHAYTPDLTYVFQLYTSAAQGYGITPFYAYANYRFRDEFQVRAGRMRIMTTRAQAMSDTAQHFMDRPMTDAVFGSGLGVGVMFWGKCNQRFEYYIQAVNSLSGAGNRTITNDQATPTGTNMDSNPALVFRGVWHVLGGDGDVPDGSAFKCLSDMDCVSSPALDIGFHYVFNEDEGDTATTRIPFPLPRRPLGVGGYGLTNTNGCQINQFGLDMAFKYMGFSAAGEYMLRTVDPRRAGRAPFSPWWLLTRQGDTVTQHGAYLSMGYFLPIPGMEKKLEAVARVGGVSTLANGQEGSWEYSGGLNYYLEGNNVKLQADVTRVYEAPISSSYSSLANVNDDAWVFRVQLQVAF
jgi:hypothetical protein